mmetsp:Transcript_35964/g.86590  ORF Transcript_35964/g.86590 Transcript_35964/m.86590 type:complete len:481 (+) Transcript_35964:571-2013(+)
MITAFNEVKAVEEEERDGHIDILMSEGTGKKDTQKSTPYAVIEFGLNGLNWWGKTHQNSLYVDRMCSGTKQAPILSFEKPVLMATVTVDMDEERLKAKGLTPAPAVEVRMGAFLCTRKDETYRISLVGHAQYHTITEASQWFGRFLRAVVQFRSWRDTDFGANGNFQYLSSNCCKVKRQDGTFMILRNFDSRIHPTRRSPKVYFNCPKIVGDDVDDVETIVQFPSTPMKSDESKKKTRDEKFFCMDDNRELLIIGIPYRDGDHVAKRPIAFIPVIDHLQELHKLGFVHGDIRAYNTVFENRGDAEGKTILSSKVPEEEKQASEFPEEAKKDGDQPPNGWLIDFDFGGQEGDELRYPKGYKAVLADGSRVGLENKQICMWHDWFALGSLIFVIHKIETDDLNSLKSVNDMEKKWTKGLFDSKRPPSDDEINDLKKFLKDEKLKISPSVAFQNDLDNLKEVGAQDTKEIKTRHGATGTPFGK